MKVLTKQPRGQILVMFIVVLTVLLAFAALALDGGMIYVDRRTDQTVSDAASLAGAGKAAEIFKLNNSCQNALTLDINHNGIPDVLDSAITRANDNNIEGLQIYTSDQVSGANGVWAECSAPPNYSLTCPGNSISDTYTYLCVHTYITTKVQTSFAHLFYKGDINNSVTSVARVSTGENQVIEAAITSLNENPSCNGQDYGMVFSGNGTTEVLGGGIHSNSCINSNGDVTVLSCIDVNLDGHCTSPTDPPDGITTVVPFDVANNGVVSPTPTYAPAIPPYTLIPPDCASLNYGGQVNASNNTTIHPGRYTDMKITNNKKLTMTPGLYCLSGGFVATGGMVIANGVTLYMTGGGISISGSVDVTMTATCSRTWPAGDDRRTNCTYWAQDYSPNPMPGFLIVMAEGNTNPIKLAGTSGSNFTGTVYTAGGDIDITGTAGAGPSYNTQLIGKNVKINGNPGINITNVPRGDFPLAPQLDHWQ